MEIEGLSELRAQHTAQSAEVKILKKQSEQEEAVANTLLEGVKQGVRPEAYPTGNKLNVAA